MDRLRKNFMSLENVRKLFLELRSRTELPVNTEFIEDLVKIMKKTWNSLRVKNKWKVKGLLPQLNEMVLTESLKELGLRYKLTQEAKKNLKKAQETYTLLVNTYNDCKDKEDFQSLVQSRIPLDQLITYRKAIQAGMLKSDVFSKWTDSYLKGLKKKEEEPDRSGFVGDRPFDPPFDSSNNLKLTYPRSNSIKEYIIHVDSRNRDVNDYPLPNRYRFKFGTQNDPDQARGVINNIDNFQLRNIVQIKLLRTTFTNFSLFLAPNAEFPYLFIDLDEIEGNTYTSVPEGRRVFGRLQNTEPRSTVNRFVDLDPTGCNKEYNIRQPKDNLPSLTINLLNLAGEPADFGEDGIPILTGSATSPTVITTSIPHTLTTGERVYISDFIGSSDDQAVNTGTGHIVNVLTPTTFEIPVNLTVAGSGGYVLIGFKQHSLTFSVSIMPEALINKYEKIPPPFNG